VRSQSLYRLRSSGSYKFVTMTNTLDSGYSVPHKIVTMTNTLDSGYYVPHKIVTMTDTLDSDYSGSYKIVTMRDTLDSVHLEAFLIHNSYLLAHYDYYGYTDTYSWCFDVNMSLNSVRCRGVSTKTLATKKMARFVALISRKL
jgi:hypothetical protein